MAAIYERAEADVMELLSHVMEAYHAPLVSIGTVVDILMASPTADQNGDPRGPAVQLHGKACAAIIRTVPYRERVKGGGDLEITIDKAWWEEHDRDNRIALLDHELSHRVPKTNQYGELKRDDLDRPLFNTILHDFEFGWFAPVARRHGAKSVEVEQAGKMITSELWTESIGPHLPTEPQRSAIRRRRMRDTGEL